MNRFKCDPEDRAWLEELRAASGDWLKSVRPKKVAAISGSSETFEVELDRDLEARAPSSVYVKRYRYRSWKALLGGFFRGVLFGKSRARIEFEVLREMQRRGVRVVRPIAYTEQRRRRVLRSCVLITESEPDAEPLGTYFAQHAPIWDLRRRRRFIGRAGEAVARLHDAGVMHGGLFWRNILVTQTEEGWEFTLLDPNRRVRLYDHAVPLRAGISDLSDYVASALAFQSATDIARFLSSYEDAQGTIDAKRKDTIRSIVSSALTKAKHEARRIASATNLEWLERRIRRRGSATDQLTFGSVDELFSALEKVSLIGIEHSNPVLRFELLGPDASRETQVRTVVFEQTCLRVEEDGRDDADLIVRTDAEALLAVVNADSNALEVIQSGRLGLKGDPRPLALLGKLIDRGVDKSDL